MKEGKIEEILEKEFPKYQSLGCGLHDNVFYFGIKLNDEEKQLDAIITSDHKIFIAENPNNDIKEIFGLNYRFPFYSEVIDYNWSRTGEFGIRNWLKENIREISLSETFEDVYELNKWKVWYPNDIVHKFIALDIVSTYFMPIFESHGRTLIYGESEFGKTRQTKIYQLLAFNPSMSIDFSDPSIFRIIESTNATILVDNFDTLDEEKQKKIKHLFQTGYTSSQKAVRIEGKQFKPKTFNIYAHMVLNSRFPLDEVSENRSNIIRMLKTTDPQYVKLEPDSPAWSETRDKQYVCVLQNWEKVKKSYNELKENKLVARELERALPHLAIAKMISEELYNEILSWLLEEVERRKVRDLREDWLYVAVEHIIEKIEEQKTNEIELKAGDIAEAKASMIFNVDAKDFEKQIHGYKIFLGKIFKANPLFQSRIIDGYSYYKFKKENLLQFCKMKGFDELVKKLEQKTLNEVEK